MAISKTYIEEEYHKAIYNYTKVIMWASVVLFVITILSFIRTFHIQHIVDRLDKNTTNLSSQIIDSREAAVEARDKLKEVLNRVEEYGPSAGAVKEALESVNRIEVHLCGGRCESKN